MPSRTTVVIELAADAQHARDLAVGGIFAPGCSLELNQECAVVVRGEGGALRIQARVVFVDPGRGAGLELVGFGPAMKEQLAALVAGHEAPGGEHADWAAEWTDGPPRSPVALAAALHGGRVARPAPASELARGSGEVGLPADAGSPADAGWPIDAVVARGSGEVALPADASAPGDAGDPAADGGLAGGPSTIDDDPSIPRSLRERLRNLSLVQQVHRAHSVDLQERILLERMYGKSVWEALLRNPRLTAPEVARIARMATLPRPLLEVILGNAAWLAIPDVRRALLANPRLAPDQALRVLRLLSKVELRLVAVQSTYPFPVRDAAKRLLREP